MQKAACGSKLCGALDFDWKRSPYHDKKKEKNILWHILLPIVLILVLIPPACSLVFWHFADQFAHYAAASELGKIQEPLTALIGKTFSAEPEEIGAGGSQRADSWLSASGADDYRGKAVQTQK